MKAVWYERNGPAHEVLRVGEMDKPAPAAGEVLVQVAWSGVNPSDVKRRAGWRGQASPTGRVVPNNDGSGVITAVGPGVDAKRVGERVWLHSTGWKRALGTAAEYTVTPTARAIRLPDAVALKVGAALGVPALTAHRLIHGLGAIAGRRVLVAGGAGSVGFYAVQLARFAGASVIATVGSIAKAKAVEQAGAELVVDYHDPRWVDRVLAAGGPVDHVVEVDFAANQKANLRLLAANGSLATFASMSDPEPSIDFYAWMTRNVRLLWVFVYEMPDEAIAAGAREINDWLASGGAQHQFAGSFSLDCLADAHVAVENAAHGKVLVEVGGDAVAG